MARIRVARVRWHFPICFTALGLLTLAAWKPPADDRPAPDKSSQSTATKTNTAAAETAADPNEIRDLTELVEVTVVGGLRSTGKTEHSAAISLKNISDEDLSGPLVVVIDGTGIATLTVQEPDGTLEDEKPYVDVLDKKGTLKPGRTLRTQKIEFRTDETLTLAVRQQFDLKARVLYLPEEARTAHHSESDGDEKIEGKNYSQRQFDRVAAIQERWTLPLIKRGNGLVYGTAVAEDGDGNLVVEVYSQREGVAEQLPDNVDGVPVQNSVIGTVFRAGPATRGGLIYPNGVPTRPANERKGEPVPDAGPAPDPAQSGAASPQLQGPGGDPTIRFPRPVPIGVSISNADRLFAPDPDDSLCYSGTLGCRCVDALGTQYILTNAHVGAALFLELPSGNINLDSPDLLTGIPGESIVQQATGDGFCTFNPLDEVGFLADFVPLSLGDFDDIVDGLEPIHFMDAAVVQAFPGMVDFCTPVDGYAAPKRDLANPRIGMPVQKYGRTTVYTNGKITGLNAFVIVLYGNNDGFAGFIKQIVVTNSVLGAPFGAPGDSGSLIVARRPGHRDDNKPVGLLFAGGGFTTIANPIGAVLGRFELSIDDGSGRTSTAGLSGTEGSALGPLDPPSQFR